MKDNIQKMLSEGKTVKVVSEGEIKSEGEVIKLIITKEIIDRDGETVSVDGMDITNFLKNPVLLDAHYMNGSVIQTMLGKIVNLQKTTDENGVKMIMGEIEFAPNPNGQIAKDMVKGGFAKTFSVGYSVTDYNAQLKRITGSELYEVSLVNVPANVEAQITKGMKEGESMSDKLFKTISNYTDIKPKIKQYRALFMSDALFEKLGLTKSDDELVNMKNIYDEIMKEAEPVEKEDEENKDKSNQENPDDKKPVENQPAADPAAEDKKDPVEDENIIEPTDEQLEDMVGDSIRRSYLSAD
jgi:HK97 family phage prohead protease